jgi:hypothetical protein
MSASGYPSSKLYGFNYSSLLVSDTASAAAAIHFALMIFMALSPMS